MEERRARSSSAKRRRDRAPSKPLDFALRRLARRDHGTRELARKMARAGYPSAEIDPTLDFLRSRGFLDDSAFALGLARSAAEHKLWGPARIERKLRDLELPDGDIQRALEDVFPEGESEPALKALEKLLRSSRRIQGERGRARAYRHLCGRGFSPSVVHRLVSTWNFEDTGDSETS